MNFAFISRVDRTSPDKAYPTIVYPHGHVPQPDPPWHTALSFGPATTSATPDPLEPHFSFAPWGRGNAGYRDG